VEKLVYVLWKPSAAPAVSDLEFARALLEAVAPKLTALGAHGLTLHVVDADAQAVSRARISRMEAPVSGFVSFWLDTADDRAPLERELEAATSRLAGYLVVESVPRRNTAQRAPLGRRTPGIVMMALLERPERIAWQDWIAHWHGHHRKVALETQCTFLYVRNVVVRALTPGAPPWAGIVEEGFPAEAVTDPMRWYKAEGSPETLKRNVKRMVESCRAFLDLDRVESHPMSEYRFGEVGEGPPGE
jgi:hypothetical protein